MERTDQQQQISGTTLYGTGFKSMIKKKSLKQNVHGFTLLELLLYVAMVTIILSALIPFTWDIIGLSVKSKVQQEVSANARYVAERINYEIRNATAMNASDFGVNLATDATKQLSLTSSSNGVTLIKVSSGGIATVTYGGNTHSLNSNDTKVTNLTFTNFTSSDNKTRHIQSALTIDSTFTQTRQEYRQTVTLETSAEVRSIP